jgi:hypothetical protein
MNKTLSMAAVMLPLLLASTSDAADSVAKILRDIAEFEEQAREVKAREDRKASILRTRANSLIVRLERVPKEQTSEVQAAKRKVQAIVQELDSKRTSGAPAEPAVKVPKRQFPPGTPPGSLEDATTARVDVILARYRTPIRVLDVGRKLGLKREDAAIVMQETDRFTREYVALVQQWAKDVVEVRAMPSTPFSEGRRWFADSQLNASVPNTLHMQVRRSRWYLEAGLEGSLRLAKEKLGLIPHRARLRRPWRRGDQV